MGSELRVYVTLRPTAVSCETVDRYIIAVRRCYRSMPHAGLMLFGSLVCGVDYDSLLFLFCMRLFLFAALCGASCYVRSVL